MGSYGLFRQMTGVGPHWEVQRPELVIEGVPRDPPQEWRPISFKHKPQALETPPTTVAPHQPRLDWQMWFTALNPSYKTLSNRDSYIFVLLWKLLEGSPNVYRLLGEQPEGSSGQAPFSPDNPPVSLRIKRYHYDFTKYNTSWNRHRLEVDGKDPDEEDLLPLTSCTWDRQLASFIGGKQPKCDDEPFHWWRREFAPAPRFPHGHEANPVRFISWSGIHDTMTEQPPRALTAATTVDDPCQPVIQIFVILASEELVHQPGPRTHRP